jgi:hypothetical protein
MEMMRRTELNVKTGVSATDQRDIQREPLVGELGVTVETYAFGDSAHRKLTAG